MMNQAAANAARFSDSNLTYLSFQIIFYNSKIRYLLSGFTLHKLQKETRAMS
jgi:hypothetical protein